MQPKFTIKELLERPGASTIKVDRAGKPPRVDVEPPENARALRELLAADAEVPAG